MNETLSVRSANQTEASCSNILDKQALTEYIVAFIGDVVGCVLAVFLAKKLERKVMITSFAVLSQLIIILTYFDLNEVLQDILNLLLRLYVTGTRFSLWMVAVEAFPADLRGTASTFAHAIGDAGGTIGSFLTYLMYPTSPVAVLHCTSSRSTSGFSDGVSWRPSGSAAAGLC